MFTHYRTHGFIINKIDSGEVDRIFTIYTEDFGKLDFLAKAERKIKSKLRAGLELFYLSEIEFIQGKAYKTLTDAILINNFQNLRKDLKKLSIASEVTEALDNLVKGEEFDKKIWQLLFETFEKLDSPSLEIKTQNLIYYYFLWNFLSILGYQPELYHCSSCQKKLSPDNIYFNLRGGGLVCGDCKESENLDKKVESDTVKMIRVFLEKDWKTLERLKFEDKQLEQLKNVSEAYLSETLDRVK